MSLLQINLCFVVTWANRWEVNCYRCHICLRVHRYPRIIITHHTRLFAHGHTYSGLSLIKITQITQFVKLFTNSAKSWRKIPLHPCFTRAFGPHGSDWLAFLNRGLKWIQNRLGWSTEGQRGRLPSTLAVAEFKFNGQKFKREGTLGFDLWRPFFYKKFVRRASGQTNNVSYASETGSSTWFCTYTVTLGKVIFQWHMIHNGISYYTHIQTQIQTHTHTWINV